MFQGLSLYDSLVFGALIVLVFYVFNQEKRMKVQDRQFRTLLSRLNELTNREDDDYSCSLDE